MKYLFACALLAAALTLFAQKGFGYKEASVVFKKGDSLRCLVKMQVDYKDTVIYKMHENGDEKILLSADISKIRFPFKLIENVRTDSIEKLSTLLLTGRITVYSYAILTMGKTVDIKNGAGLKFTPGTTSTHYIVYKDGRYKEIREDFFRRDLAPLIKDCPGMYRKLDTEGYYFEDLVKIATEYNSCELLLPNAE
ncbi:MAG: hypothetical protein U0V75_18470 [Ferruginibacter sp.]